MLVFPAGADRNKALGIWGSLGAVGAMAGLLLGGLLVEVFTWRSIFLVNVPVGAVLWVLAWRVVSRDRPGARTRRSFDVLGGMTITGAVFAVSYGIVQILSAGWGSWSTSAALGAGAGLAAVFLWIESRTSTPLLPPGMVRSRPFVIGNALIVLAAMAVDGMLVTLTQLTQVVLTMSPVEFGLVAATMTATSLIGGMLGQYLVSRVGPLPIAVVGMGLLGAACLTLASSASPGASVARLVAALALFGIGMGCAAVAAQITALSDVAAEDAGVGAGFADVSFALGSSFGIAIASTVAYSALPLGQSVPAPVADVAAGYQDAFLAVAVITAIGVVIAATGALARRAPQR